MIAVLSYTPVLADAFHLAPITPWLWLSLLAWPPLVLGAEELRKALVRRRS
jgi:Ca2+-transporting ATPase